MTTETFRGNRFKSLSFATLHGSRDSCATRISSTVVERHFLWHPKANAAANQSKPNHEVILLCAAETCHGVAEKAGVNKE